MDLADAVALARSFNLNTVFAVEDDWVSVIDCGDGSRRPLGRFSARLHAPEDEPRCWVYVIRLADAVRSVESFSAIIHLVASHLKSDLPDSVPATHTKSS